MEFNTVRIGGSSSSMSRRFVVILARASSVISFEFTTSFSRMMNFLARSSYSLAALEDPMIRSSMDDIVTTRAKAMVIFGPESANTVAIVAEPLIADRKAVVLCVHSKKCFLWA